MELTPKQQALYQRGVAMFKQQGQLKAPAILQKVRTTYDVELKDYTDDDVRKLLNDTVYDLDLFSKFIMPPFTVLDSRSGDWVSRRNLLDDYLGSSLVGRTNGLAYGNLQVRQNDNGTSRFDSVLCELLLKWFGFSGCNVLDPFAGGHVRGSMASLLGYNYIGIDLSADQIAANKQRGLELNLHNISWYCADALELGKYIFDNSQDLIFTCPPYGDLEQYTNDPRDLSNMDYKRFLSTYDTIIRLAVPKLKDNRFAVMVVGDFRDKEGFYRGFVADTIKCFEWHGMKLYNEAILLNSVGTASMRASGAFTNRKLIKVHQNVLVFYKGDPKLISQQYGSIDSSLPIPQPKQNALF